MGKISKTEWILRIGIFGMFIGHGMIAIGVKESWIPYLTTVGFTAATARIIMPLIGILDILVGFILLFRPIQSLLLWATVWSFATAIIRPISDFHGVLTSSLTANPFWDFVERTANYAAPLALWFMKKPKK